MDNPTMRYMAKKFSNMRFRINLSFKPKMQSSTPNKRFISRAGSSRTNGAYKIEIVEPWFICYNYNELRHFAFECKQQGKNFKESYRSKKNKGKSFLAEGK